MSHQEFENYLSLIGKLLQLTRDQRDQIAGELRDHLELRVADLVKEGVNHRDAVAQALEEFGDAAVMARNFQTVLNHKRRRWMMRFATFSIAGTFLAAILVMAMWPDGARFGTPGTSLALTQESDGSVNSGTAAFPEREISFSSKQTRLAAKVLKKPVNFDYDETPFSEVMEELSAQTKLNFLLHESARNDSLTPDETVTLKLNGLPLDIGLDFMLSPFNSTYVIDSGVVVIISLDDAEDERFLRTRMFECQELLDSLQKSLPKPVVNSKPGFNSKGGGKFSSGGGAGGPGSSLPKSSTVRYTNTPSPGAQVATSDTTLLNLIHTHIAPDSWETKGMGLANADVVNGVLVVRQTESSFRKIENLLDDLRIHVLDK